jgi:Ser-tRNA(Ala) deacylase AlaX
METKLLYLEDSYLKEWRAKIISIFNNEIELDQTAFYPESGGQLSDKGILVYNGKDYQILSVKKGQGKIVHHLHSADGLRLGYQVTCSLDWPLRYMMMRMHTAAHILSAIIHKETQALITGNQLGLDKTRIDFDLEDFDRDLMQSFIEKANQEILKDHEISSFTISRKEAEASKFCKLAKGLPPQIQDIRIIKIGELDEQADGGTHVKNTKEVGKLVFLSADNKGAKRRRVYFTLE